jgi:hypothetical protein
MSGHSTLSLSLEASFISRVWIPVKKPSGVKGEPLDEIPDPFADVLAHDVILLSRPKLRQSCISRRQPAG